jgi:hypothetical protein
MAGTAKNMRQEAGKPFVAAGSKTGVAVYPAPVIVLRKNDFPMEDT